MTIPKAISGDRWTEKTARHIFPILVWCAENGKIITYAQLDSEIVKNNLGNHVNYVVYGKPAGAIGKALLELEDDFGFDIPPINALVVNAKSGLPSYGVDFFIERYCQPNKVIKKMNDEERKALIEEIYDRIYSFEKWSEILAFCELKKIDYTPNYYDKSLFNKIQNLSIKGGWSNESESIEHKNLKNHISLNPQIVGLSNDYTLVKNEYMFFSGDEADILFSNTHNRIAIEVKSIKSNDNDLQRGIFQCIKYQALLRAEQRIDLSPPIAKSILVTERELPVPLKEIASLLNIKCVVCAVNRNM